MEFPNLYKGDYRLLAIPPLILILLSLYFIPQIEIGVEFTGGTRVSFISQEPIDKQELETLLSEQGLQGDVKVFTTSKGQEVEILLPQDERFGRSEQLKESFSLQAEEVERAAYLASFNESYQEDYERSKIELDSIANEMFELAQRPIQAEDFDSISLLRSEFMQGYTLVYDNYRQSITTPLTEQYSISSLSLETVSPTLSLHFLDVATKVVIVSAALSIVFVFIFFRSFIPSLAVILGAFSDIVIALGAMGFFGLTLTLPSFAALLMLIGFSLDTDILLTMRMLKRSGNPRENAYDAMKTGTTMSTTTIVAFTVLLALAVFTHIPTYFEIAAVALAGLVGDLFATWGINAVLILWYVERSEKTGVSG